MESRPPDPAILSQPPNCITPMSTTEIPDIAYFGASTVDTTSFMDETPQHLAISSPPPLLVESSAQIAGKNRRRPAGGNPSASQNLKVSKTVGTKLDRKKKLAGKRSKNVKEAMDEDECEGDDEADLHMHNKSSIAALEIPLGSIPVGIESLNANKIYVDVGIEPSTSPTVQPVCITPSVSSGNPPNQMPASSVSAMINQFEGKLASQYDIVVEECYTDNDDHSSDGYISPDVLTPKGRVQTKQVSPKYARNASRAAKLKRNVGSAPLYCG